MIIDILRWPKTNSSGLALKMFQDRNFNFYVKACQKFGFRVDKNFPWRMVADIYSPNMQKYMRRYGVSPETLFDEYFTKVHEYDLSTMWVYLKDFYNSYVATWPHVNTTEGTTNSIHGSSLPWGARRNFYKDVETKKCLKYRKPVIRGGPETKKFGPKTLWIHRAYLLVRAREANVRWSSMKYREEIKKSIDND